MRTKLLINLISIVCVFLPTALFQLYLINDHWLATLVKILLLLMLFYIFLLFFGWNKKIRSYVVVLPLAVVCFFGFIKIAQYQDRKGILDEDELIRLVQKYNVQYKQYPNELGELEEKYNYKVPSIWRGLVSYEYLYYHDLKMNTVVITKKFNVARGKIWRSTEGSWEYYGRN